MEIDNLIMVKYLSRPNRFTIEFKNYEDKIDLAHLHDPGRLKELLIEDTDVLIRYVTTYKDTGRKTKYDVVAIKYENEWVLLNSSYHNDIVAELIDEKKICELKDFKVHKKEYTYGNSRLDFLLSDSENNRMFLEVKGCTLVENGLAKFPDAPTLRGKKHVDELVKIRKEGLSASIIILVLQNSAKSFTPNYETDPDFSNSLKKAFDEKVMILPAHIMTRYEKNKLILEYEDILEFEFKKEME